MSGHAAVLQARLWLKTTVWHIKCYLTVLKPKDPLSSLGGVSFYTFVR